MTVTSTVTLRPTGTTQTGSWTVIGAGNAHTALSDNTDTTYVQLTPRCREENSRMKVSFATPTLPAGSQIFSVGTRIRIQNVPAPSPQPRCVGWYECRRHQNIVTTVVELILFLIFGWLCPRPGPSDPPTASFVEQQLDYKTTDPDGNPWTLDSFSAFKVNLGRDDTAANPLRISEVYVDVTYAQQSSVTVTGPTGTITDTCRPTVTWTYSSPQEDPQQAFRVAIYSAAQVAAAGFAPFVTPPVDGTADWVLSEIQQWTADTDLVNGDWSAYVQLQQAWDGYGTFTGPIGSTSWTQAMSGAPVAILDSATFDAQYNRIRLVFEPSDDDPETTSYSVFRSDALGAEGTWELVRGGVQVPANGMTPVVVDDYEAPPNQVAQYKVLSYGTIAGVVTPADDYSNVLSVTPLSGDDVWLIDPFNPMLNTRIPVKYLGDTRIRRRVQAVFEPVSGSLKVDKVAVQGPQYGFDGTLLLMFSIRDADDYLAKFEALDASGHTLLIKWPTTEQFYLVFGPGAAGSDESYTWRPNPGRASRQFTDMSVSYTQVAKPAIT